MNGRDECPNCGGRGTERQYSTDRYKEVVCHDCGNEWKEFIGPECPSCGANNTVRRKTGVAPYRSTEIACFECGHNRSGVGRTIRGP